MGGISNEELVQKAVITTDALAAAGKLNPAQSDKFIDYLVDESVLKNNARVVRFRNESLEIDKIGIGRRVSMPAAEAQDPQVRRGVQTSKIVLTPKEVITPFEIGDSFRELSIEDPNQVEDHVIQLMTRQTSNDHEELAVHGDSLGPAVLESDYKEGGSSSHYVKDAYLALHDGWGRLCDGGHLVDAAGQNVGLQVFGKAMRAMPTKFRRNKAQLRWFMSPDLASLYYEKLTTRATALGDQAAGGAVHNPLGVPIVEVPLLDFTPPVVEHVALSSGAPTVALRYQNISGVVVTKNTLDGVPESPYTEGPDYTVDTAAGTITRVGGAIGDPETVKVTYNSPPQIWLTNWQNFIYGIGRDITIEKDRNIYKRVNEYAIHTKVSVQFEELDALVKVKNIGSEI
jgi:hypothetical protein